MTPLAKILLPLDLSARPLEDAAYAASFASEFGAELVFLHALQNEWPLRPGRKGDPRRNQREVVRSPVSVSRSSPVSGILRTAGTEQCDFILMPTGAGRYWPCFSLGRSQPRSCAEPDVPSSGSRQSLAAVDQINTKYSLRPFIGLLVGRTYSLVGEPGHAVGIGDGAHDRP